MSHNPNGEEVLAEGGPNGRFFRLSNSPFISTHFEEVYEAFDQDEGREVAWVQVNLKSIRDVRMFSEVLLVHLNSTENPAIPKIYALWKQKQPHNSLVYISDPIARRSLRDYVNTVKRLGLSTIQHWCRSLVEILVFYHTLPTPIVHGGIKLEHAYQVPSHENPRIKLRLSPHTRRLFQPNDNNNNNSDSKLHNSNGSNSNIINSFIHNSNNGMSNSLNNTANTQSGEEEVIFSVESKNADNEENESNQVDMREDVFNLGLCLLDLIQKSQGFEGFGAISNFGALSSKNSSNNNKNSDTNSSNSSAYNSLRRLRPRIPGHNFFGNENKVEGQFLDNNQDNNNSINNNNSNSSTWIGNNPSVLEGGVWRKPNIDVFIDNSNTLKVSPPLTSQQPTNTVPEIEKVEKNVDQLSLVTLWEHANNFINSCLERKYSSQDLLLHPFLLFIQKPQGLPRSREPTPIASPRISTPYLSTVVSSTASSLLEWTNSVKRLSPQSTNHLIELAPKNGTDIVGVCSDDLGEIAVCENPSKNPTETSDNKTVGARLSRSYSFSEQELFGSPLSTPPPSPQSSFSPINTTLNDTNDESIIQEFLTLEQQQQQQQNSPQIDIPTSGNLLRASQNINIRKTINEDTFKSLNNTQVSPLNPSYKFQFPSSLPAQFPNNPLSFRDNNTSPLGKSLNPNPNPNLSLGQKTRVKEPPETMGMGRRSSKFASGIALMESCRIDHTITIILYLKTPAGKREINFGFNLQEDTPEGIANEMVTALNLEKTQEPAIARNIRYLLHTLDDEESSDSDSDDDSPSFQSSHFSDSNSHSSDSVEHGIDLNLGGGVEVGLEVRRRGWEIDPSELVFTKEFLGKGTFGSVYRGKFRGSDVAIKKLNVAKLVSKNGNERAIKNTLSDFLKEVKLLSKLRNRNVLQFFGACTEYPKLYIVTEYMANGSLYSLLHNRKTLPKIEFETVISWAKDIARGMNYLHLYKPKPIIHRDLKSPNLLVSDNMTIKVGDFGFAKIREDQTGTMTLNIGTLRWLAPEVMLGKHYTEKADVYSFGVVMYEILTRQIPFARLDDAKVVQLVCHENKRLMIPNTTHPALSTIIRDCWHSEPSDRPSFSEILTRLEEI